MEEAKQRFAATDLNEFVFDEPEAKPVKPEAKPVKPGDLDPFGDSGKAK